MPMANMLGEPNFGSKPHDILHMQPVELELPICLTVPCQQPVITDAVGGAGWGSWAHRGHRLWAAMPDEFWAYTYKVRRCPQARSHDWTACPFAHKGERARRRDPRRFPYTAVSCPEFRLSGGACCARGLQCRYAHGVFELWLHPARFRTRMCEAGPGCPRRICFFAHFPVELRPDGVHECLRCVAAGTAVPPRVLCTPPAPHQLDWIMDSMAKLEITTVTTTTPSSSNSEDWVMEYMNTVGTISSINSSDAKEDVASDYPHVDLIMDLVK